MRPIKFRAWDKKGKVMLEVFQIEFAKEDGLPVTSNIIYTPGKNIILQQFTGLKDKNGKEIYEGDILKTDWYGDRLEHYEVVEYGEINCYDSWGMGFELPEMGRTSREIEVIGNIYENPKLLKGGE